MRTLVLGSALISLVLFSSCSDSSDDDVGAVAGPGNADSSAADEAYLDRIASIDEQIGAKVDEIDEALMTTWPTRGRLFDVLDEADLPGTFAAMLQEAEGLEPTELYAADHRHYTESLSESVTLGEEVQQAIQDEDLVAFSLGTTDLFLSRARLLLATSPSFCNSALRSDATPGCASGEPSPGGEYGESLTELMRAFRAEFGPRVGAFPEAFTPEERFAALEVLQPDIIAALEEGSRSSRSLDPSSEFDNDHARLVLYFEETLDVSRAISEAVAQNDFEASQREFARSGTVLCDAADDLSPEFKEIVTPFFDLDQSSCGGPVE